MGLSPLWRQQAPEGKNLQEAGAQKLGLSPHWRQEAPDEGKNLQEAELDVPFLSENSRSSVENSDNVSLSSKPSS